MGSVLMGGRTLPRGRSKIGNAIVTWLPVAVMLAVIARESTEAFSGMHTSAWLRPLWQAIFGAVTDTQWLQIHHVLRKTGHFVGYGTLGLTWLRGWLLAWLVPFRRRAAGAWRGWSFVMAICCTAVIASLDELHQTYLSDRTGVVQDVLLDTIGALIFCGVVALFWTRTRARDAALPTNAVTGLC